MAHILPSRESSPETQILARERAQQVSAALQDLSHKQRTVFLMRFIEEMDLPEIAEATGMQVNTVKTHLHRAVKAVRIKLRRHSAMTPHLTDAQFTDLLLGAIPPSVTAHLDTCPQCAQESQRVSGAIGSFEQHSRLWAENRIATQPRTPVRQPALAWLNRPAAWSGAAATVVLAAFLGISHSSDRTSDIAQPVAAVQPAQHIAPATLKSDNDMLSALTCELSADAVPPASMYGLKVDAPTSHSRPKRIAN